MTNEREYLEHLVRLAEQFRRTPIVDDDFPAYRDRFDLAVEEAKRFLESPRRPTVVCLCGSTRFYKEFVEANYRETMAGKIVLSVGFYPHSSGQVHGEGVGCDDEQKKKLDELHKRKIDRADEVLILNVGGYIGSSTRSELEYAQRLGRRVRFLNPL